MARLKVEPSGLPATSTNISLGNMNMGGLPTGTMVAASAAPIASTAQSQAIPQGTQLLGTIDCSYDDVFKEITKKLYGDESVAIADVLDSSVVSSVSTQPIVYDAGDLFSQSSTALTTNAGGLALVAAPGSNGLPSGAILVQRRLQDDKGRIWTIEGLPNTGEQIAFATLATPTGAMQAQPQMMQIQGAMQQTQLVVQQQLQLPPPQPQQPPPAYGFEERWFESDEILNWTQSKIARYNPTQKVFRCVDCDFIGFLSRVAEHWLGNHADLRVFQCPRCTYTSAWARCVRMHLTRQHGETLPDNSLWKENPVLEEVTKFLNTLKTKVEQKSEPVNPSGEKRYICPYCPYQTDRRDLYNRHENIHRDEKPFQCYVCDKQFNRADHVKKHFIRMHREHPYDINKIRRVNAKAVQFLNGSKLAKQKQKQAQLPETQETGQDQFKQENQEMALVGTSNTVIHFQQGAVQSTSLQQVPHLAYLNPSAPIGQNGPLQGIPGVGGGKKEGKGKGHKKKRTAEKMYTCSYCPWQGVDNWCLKRHLNTHIKPFLCALCDYKAARSERLATHVLKVHNKRVCHKCSFLADDTDSLSQHIQDSHQNPLVKTGFNCNLCQEYFELRADLEAHAILEHQKVIVQCDLCDFRTTDELSMESHLRNKHNLTPGMGAVAAAAAAAAAAAVGQPLNTQYLQNQSQEETQIAIPSQINTDQILTQPALPSTPQPSAGSSQEGSFTHTSASINITKVIGNAEIAEPETLCDKCGIDFVDEDSRRLHERRHALVDPSEDEAVKGTKFGTKRLLRSYICSTCSYTCSTKKMMMQHQRAHTGFEMMCRAEKCMFSTPFENTLKEHIQNEHGTEEHVRCPHCGLRMPSNSAFTSHWRFHHTTICSLCVNIYRVRYDVKENDIHDVICKTANSSFSSQEGDSSLVNKMDADFSTRLPSVDTLGISSDLGAPPQKRIKLDEESNNSSTSTLYKRESIQFLPRLTELIVTPMRSRVQDSSRKPRRRRKGRLDNGESASSFVRKCKSGKRIDKWLEIIGSKEKERSTGVGKISPHRRYCQKGTYPWLYRNPRDGFKCWSSLCENRRSWRYPRRTGLVLHQLWFHTQTRFKCDICGLQFRHLYKALLHKSIEHEGVGKGISQQRLAGSSGT